MGARRAEVARAYAQSDLAKLEVVEELVPFFGGEVAVLLSGAQGAAPGDEGPVMGDDVLGVDGGVSQSSSKINMSEDLGGDVRWQARTEGLGRK
jgi:hypothetical protein